MSTRLMPNELLSQVNQFWSMLDDMAESSPESYQKFIQRHLKEGKEYMEPPEPYLCVQTNILDPKDSLLFINICGWKRVPPPQSDAHPVPLLAGKLDDTSEGTVIDIAYSPEILKRAIGDHFEQHQLIQLAMKYIEQQHKVTLCHSYHIAPFKQMSHLQTIQNNLQGKPKMAAKGKTKPEKGVDVSLLEQLKNIAVKGEEDLSPHIQIMEEGSHKPVKAGLIEVISSTEVNEKDLLTTPQHELTVVNDPSGTPHKIILRAELPRLPSASDCDLSVSKDDLMLEVPGKYRLHLVLPAPVDEDSVTAKHNKANNSLTVTMLVLDSPAA
ncbi:PIH1 domain-containing protein 2 [Hyperolius riggenbachi]|uniref:PIH1 domain-containing protein 2 n=1 Tax=Hyperolius riggenbachi TaxID=752182 RepID=UPI0035A3A1B8